MHHSVALSFAALYVFEQLLVISYVILLRLEKLLFLIELVKQVFPYFGVVCEQLLEQLELIALVVGHTQTANIGLSVHIEELELLLRVQLAEGHGVFLFLRRASVRIVRLVR